MPRVTRSSVKSAVEVKENVITTVFEEQTTPKTKRQQKRKTSSPDDYSSSSKSSRSNSLSPLRTSFANKLNIGSAKSDNLRSARCALAENSEFRLPGREQEFDFLTTYLKDLIKSNAAGSLYISGPPGTGKKNPSCLETILI